MTGIAPKHYYQAPADAEAGIPPTLHGYTFWCPGCKDMHAFATNKDTVGQYSRARWEFNGDMGKPTFSPSLGIRDWDDTTGEMRPGFRCHLFLTDGVIRFLGDCRHELAGESVPLGVHPANDPNHEANR